MSLTRRGKVVVSIAGALSLVGVGGIALALTGHAPAVIQRAVDKVTGQEPVFVKGALCKVWSIEIPAEHAIAVQGDLANVALRHVAALFVQHPQLDIRQRPAGR